MSGELYLALVLSTKAHATIKSVDWSRALAMPGVVDKLDHTDVPGANVTGFPVSAADEETFVSAKVGATSRWRLFMPSGLHVVAAAYMYPMHMHVHARSKSIYCSPSRALSPSPAPHLVHNRR